MDSTTFLLTASLMLMVGVMTYSKLITGADCGGTADTWTDLGDITINDLGGKGKGTCHGVWMQAAVITTTTAEANHGQFRFDFSQMGGPNLIMNGPPMSGAAIGTQSTTDFRTPVLRATSIPITAGGKLNCQFSTHTPDPTAGCGVIMGLLYSDSTGALHPGFSTFFPRPSPLFDSDTEAVGDGSTTAATPIAALDIPTSATRIIGFGQEMVPDAVQANGEEFLGYIRYDSSLSTWTPQEYPLPACDAPLAGTTVGQGTNIPNPDDTNFPASIPTLSVASTVTPNVIMVTAVTGAVSEAATVMWV